jgi:hypothetical protein
MTTSEQWVRAINSACTEPDVARSNYLITMLHYLLSEAMADAMGREGGPNFHSWAVWGSQKAGVTIRQEDLDNATVHGTAWASIAGSVVGAVGGVFVGHWLSRVAAPMAAAIGAGTGALVAGWAGKQLAMGLRAKAARFLLQGNRTVLEEIGEQTARFLEVLEGGATEHDREAFFAGLRTGPTEGNGQDRLATAFRSYFAAVDAKDVEAKRAAMLAGNCATVYHEHIRLEPYIRGAMPWMLRRCATRWWMTYKIGDRRYSVGDDLPGVGTATAAKNWTKIEERMRYVFALFEGFHNAPEVFAVPYPEMEMARSVGDPLTVAGEPAVFTVHLY